MGPTLHCEHCGNRGIHTVIDSVTETELFEFEAGNSFEEEFEIVFTRCENCLKHSLYAFLNGSSDESTSLYPKEKQIAPAVPRSIRDAYTEALKIKRHSSIAFVIMVRRALELLCKQEKAKGANLFNKIEDLGKKGIIPKALSEMSDLIRLLGNEGAHSDSKVFTNEEIEVLDYFYSAIIEYVYVAPNKIARLKEKLK